MAPANGASRQLSSGLTDRRRGERQQTQQTGEERVAVLVHRRLESRAHPR
jgi:hypothetical protein